MPAATDNNERSLFRVVVANQRDGTVSDIGLAEYRSMAVYHLLSNDRLTAEHRPT